MDQMNKKKRTNKSNKKNNNEEQISKTSKPMIIGGVILAMISIGLLIFVLSEKIFDLS